jgi:hypothetical protein
LHDGLMSEMSPPPPPISNGPGSPIGPTDTSSLGSSQFTTAQSGSNDTAANAVGSARALLGRAPIVIAVVIACHVAAIALPDDGNHPYWELGMWCAFGVGSALLLAAPLFGSAIKLSVTDMWRTSAAGAAGLSFHWVAFVLPSLRSNPSFLMTMAVVGAWWAVSLLPGRPAADPVASK